PSWLAVRCHRKNPEVALSVRGDFEVQNKAPIARPVAGVLHVTRLSQTLLDTRPGCVLAKEVPRIAGCEHQCLVVRRPNRNPIDTRSESKPTRGGPLHVH